MKQGNEFVMLSKTRFFYIALVVSVVFPTIGLTVFAPPLAGVWCRQFDIPKYEQQFGFRLGSVDIVGAGSERQSVIGIVWVSPAGAFARAGLRAGDIPRMHHGIGEFCGELAVAAGGGEAHLSVVNAGEPREGHHDRRAAIVRVVQR